MLSPRAFFLLALLICAVMSGGAIYFQLVMQLEPCPLCTFQRIATLLVGIVMLLAVLHNPHGWAIRLYGAFAGLFALIGGGIATRHVWLQSLPPDEVPSCGPSLGFMLDHFPLNKTINLVLRGSGECADVMWSFMGLTIPAWALIAFCMLMIIAWGQVFRKLERNIM